MKKGDFWLVAGIIIALIIVTLLAFNIESFFPLPPAEQTARELMNTLNSTR